MGPAAGVAQQRAAPGSAPAGLSRPAQAAAQAAQQQRAPMSPEQYERYLRGVKELTSSHLFDVALLPMKRKGVRHTSLARAAEREPGAKLGGGAAGRRPGLSADSDPRLRPAPPPPPAFLSWR